MMRCSEYHVINSEAMKRVEFVNNLNTYQLLENDSKYVLPSKVIGYLRYKSVTSGHYNFIHVD